MLKSLKDHNEFKFVLSAYFLWRIFLYVALFFAIRYVPLQEGFLGGGLEAYRSSPYFWAFTNFDGEHYLSIAYQGYLPLTYFFFPVYPLLTAYIANLLGGSFFTHALISQVISNLSLVISLVGLYKLILLDKDEAVARRTIVVYLLFPTSFYFASAYTESLFLALIVWSFYFIRRGKWMSSGFLGAISTATRVVGISLLPSFVLEVLKLNSLEDVRELGVRPLKFLRGVGPLKIVMLLLIPAGLVAYMYYLNKVTGDPLEFFTNVGIYGAQRSNELILLPQVFYRYIFKIIPEINYDYFPIVLTTYLEFTTALVFGLVTLILFWKTRLSYALFSMLVYFIPTLSGSFSSLPRYVLACFPVIIYFSILSLKMGRKTNIIISAILLITLSISFSLFARGYWVS